MTVELTALFAAVCTLFVIIGVQGLAHTFARSLAFNLGPRDEPPPTTKFQGRAARTLANHIEGLAMFAPLVLIAHVSDIATPTTAWGAMLFAGARVVYAPLYLLGVPVARTLAWTVGAVGLVMIGVELVRFGL